MRLSFSRAGKSRKARETADAFGHNGGNGHAAMAASDHVHEGVHDILPIERHDGTVGTHGTIDKLRRDVIFREGTQASHIYEVVEGGVIIFKTLEDGRRQIFGILGPGAWIGSSAGRTYHYSAECLTAVRLVSYGLAEIDNSQALQRQLAMQLQHMLDSLQEHAVLLGRRTAMERVAWFLLSLPQLSARLGKQPRGGMVQTTLKQRDIGDYLGLKVETISRNLAILKRRMIIATGKRGQFRLLDPDALRRMADPDGRGLAGLTFRI